MNHKIMRWNRVPKSDRFVSGRARRAYAEPKPQNDFVAIAGERGLKEGVLARLTLNRTVRAKIEEVTSAGVKIAGRANHFDPRFVEAVIARPP